MSPRSLSTARALLEKFGTCEYPFAKCWDRCPLAQLGPLLAAACSAAQSDLARICIWFIPTDTTDSTFSHFYHFSLSMSRFLLPSRLDEQA